MTETFSLGGDPASIRGSAQHWSNFASAATGAASDVQAVDSSEFVGDEGETYRSRINTDMHPHLTTTGSAWEKVAGALHTYAGELETLQQRMSSLKVQAGHHQDAVNQASTNLSNAQSADAGNSHQRLLASQKLKPGETLPVDTYVTQSGSASTTLSNARADLNGTIAAAATVRSDHSKALKACCGTINAAKEMRFQKPPGFWDKVGSFVCDKLGDGWNALKAGVSWAAEHIGPVLKIISAVAGLLALIPFLAPVMGPIALVTGGAALLLDVANKLMNGKGSWLQIGIDAVGLIPGVKALTSTAKVAKVAKAGKALDGAETSLKGARSTLMAASKNTRMAKSALAVQKGTGRNAVVRGFKSTFNRDGIKSAENALNNSRGTLATSRSALNSAKSKYASELANFGKAEKFAKNHDLAWKVIDPLASAGGTALTGVKTYQDTNGDWGAVVRATGVAALGQKIPGASNKFNGVQGIVANGAATVNQGVNMAQNPEKLTDPKEWAKLTSSAVKTGTSVHTVAANGSAGTQSGATGANGSHERSAFDRKEYAASNQSTTANNGFGNAAGMISSIEANRG